VPAKAWPLSELENLAVGPDGTLGYLRFRLPGPVATYFGGKRGTCADTGHREDTPLRVFGREKVLSFGALFFFIKVSGTCHVPGDLSFFIKVSGTCHVPGDMSFFIKVSITCHVPGDL
jgi:hypothetical protein